MAAINCNKKSDLIKDIGVDIDEIGMSRKKDT